MCLVERLRCIGLSFQTFLILAFLFFEQFEYQQAQLELEIENLSWKLERDERYFRGVSKKENAPVLSSGNGLLPSTTRSGSSDALVIACQGLFAHDNFGGSAFPGILMSTD